MDFPGFTAEDFELFHIPDFAGRMGEIRSRLRPKLVALAGELAPEIEEITGVATFPHAAQHMRRRVNPPPETWAAFCRDRRGYKRWIHYRVAVSADGVRTTVFVEDDADDKPTFGKALRDSAGKLLRELQGDARVEWYTLDGGASNKRLSGTRLAEAGRSLIRLKTAKFQAGVPLPADEAQAMSAEELKAWALAAVRQLRPLYLAGAAASG